MDWFVGEGISSLVDQDESVLSERLNKRAKSQKSKGKIEFGIVKPNDWYEKGFCWAWANVFLIDRQAAKKVCFGTKRNNVEWKRIRRNKWRKTKWNECKEEEMADGGFVEEDEE